MSGLRFVLLATMTALASCAPQPSSPASSGQQPTTAKPEPQPTTPKQEAPRSLSPPKVVDVEIIVDNVKAHQVRCEDKKAPLPPTTVLVTGADVRHCVNGELLNHGDEKTDPEKFKLTLVQVSAGDSIRWFSKNTLFAVVEVAPHTPGEKPDYPFGAPMSTALANEHRSSPVINLEGAVVVVRQYKVSFDIGKIGARVDPDIVCSM